MGFIGNKYRDIDKPNIGAGLVPDTDESIFDMTGSGSDSL